MKNKINSILVLCLLIIIGMACNASFTTANISSFNFGKNETATPTVTDFNVGDKIYAVATVSNTSGKHKIKFVVNTPVKGETPLTKEIEFEGSKPVFLFFNAIVDGEFKIEATLFDDQGKEIDKKAGSVSVKASSQSGAMDKTKADSPDSDDKETN